MKRFKNECEITVKTPSDWESYERQLRPPWDDWCNTNTWKALTAERCENNPGQECLRCKWDEDCYEHEHEHAYIHIDEDPDWWKGIERICALYLAVRYPEHFSAGMNRRRGLAFDDWPWVLQSDSDDMNWEKKLEGMFDEKRLRSTRRRKARHQKMKIRRTKRVWSTRSK
jgi:hypothetical protein